MFSYLFTSRKEDGEEEEYEYVTDEEIIEDGEGGEISEDEELVESADEGIIEKTPGTKTNNPTLQLQKEKGQEAPIENFDARSSKQSTLLEKETMDGVNHSDKQIYAQHPENYMENRTHNDKKDVKSLVKGSSYSPDEGISKATELDSSGRVMSTHHGVRDHSEELNFGSQNKEKAAIQTIQTDAESHMVADIRKEESKSTKVSVAHDTKEETLSLVPSKRTENEGKQSATTRQLSYVETNNPLAADSSGLEDTAKTTFANHALDASKKDLGQKQSTEKSAEAEQPNSQVARRWSLLGGYGNPDEDRSALEAKSQKEYSTASTPNIANESNIESKLVTKEKLNAPTEEKSIRLRDSVKCTEQEAVQKNSQPHVASARRWSLLGGFGSSGEDSSTAGTQLQQENDFFASTANIIRDKSKDEPKVATQQKLDPKTEGKSLRLTANVSDAHNAQQASRNIATPAMPEKNARVQTFLVNDELLAQTLSIYEEISAEDELLLESFRASEQQSEGTDEETVAAPVETDPASLAHLKKNRFQQPRDISQESQALFDILERDFAAVTPRVTVRLAGMSRQLSAEDVKLCFVAFVSCFSPPIKSHFATDFNYTENDLGEQKHKPRSSDNDESSADDTNKSPEEINDDSKCDPERFPRPFVPSKIVNILWTDVIRTTFLDQFDLKPAVAKKIEAANGHVFDSALSFIRDTLVLLGVIDVRKIYSKSSRRNGEEILSMEESYFLDASRDRRGTVDEVVSVHQDIHQEYGEYLMKPSAKENFSNMIEKYDERWNTLIMDACSVDSRNESEASYVVQMLPWNTVRANNFKRASSLLSEKKFLHGRLKALGILEGTTAQVTDAEELLLRFFEKRDSVLCFDSIDPDQIMLNAYERTRKDITRMVEDIDTTKEDGETLTPADTIHRQRFNKAQIETGKALHLMGVSLGSQGFGEEEMELYREALQLKRLAASGPSLTISDTLHCLGFALDNNGMCLEAMDFYNQALAIRRSIVGNGDRRVAETLHNKGALLCEQGQCDEAMTCLKEALEIRVFHFGEHNETCADTQQWIGNVMRESGKHEEALQFFQSALRTKKSILGADHDEVANTLQNMAVVLDDMGSYVLSLQCYDEALRIYTLQFGKVHDRVTDTLQRIAIDYGIIEKYDEALLKFKEAIEIREKLLEGITLRLSDPTELVRSLIHADEVDLDEAQNCYGNLIECYDEARQLTQRLTENDHTSLSLIFHRLGELYFEVDDFDNALESFNEALKSQGALAEKGDVNEEQVCDLLFKKGVVHLSMKEYQSAKSCFESVVYRRRNLETPDRAAEAVALYCLGIAFDTLGAHKLALSAFNEALHGWKEVQGETDVRCGYALYWLGKQEFDVGRFTQAVVWYRGALQTFKANKSDVDYAVVAKTLDCLGSTHEQLESIESALQCYTEGARLVRWKLHENHEYLIGLLCRSGNIKQKMGLAAEAMELYEEGILVMKHCARPDDVQLCETIQTFGMLLQDQEEYERARELLSESYRLFISVLGQDNLKSADAVLKLGRVLVLQESYEAAMQCYREALRVQREKLPPDHELVAETLFCMGTNLLLRLNHKEAIQCFQQALSIQRNAHGDNHTIVARTLHNLAKAYKAVGSLDKSVVCYKEASRIISSSSDSSAEEIAELSFEMAEAHEANQNYQAAISKYQEALTVWGDSDEDTNRLTAVLRKLGLVHLDAGDNEDAIEFLQDALERLEDGNNIEDEKMLSSTLAGIAKAFSNIGSFDSAVHFYQRHIDLHKPDPSMGEAVSDSLYAIGTIYAKLNNLDDAINHFQECLVVRKDSFGGTDDRVARVLFNMGVVFEKQENFMSAKESFEEALQIYKDNGNEEEANSILQDLGRTLSKEGELDAALESYSEALQVSKKLLGSNDPQIASLHYLCGTTLFDSGEFKSALSSFRESVKIRKARLGSESKETAESVCMVGQTLEKLGMFDLAIDCLREALEVLLLIKGEESLDVANCHQALGLAFSAKGDHKMAVSNFTAALEPRKSFFGEESAELASTYFQLADSSSHLCELDAASDYSVDALRLRKVVLGTQCIEYAESLSQLGEIQLALAKRSEALNCFLDALKVFSTVEGRSHVTVAQCLEKIGLIYMEQDQHNDAIESLKRAMKIYTENLGGLTSEVASVLRILGKVEVHKESPDKAINYFKQSVDIGKELHDDSSVAASLFEIGAVLERLEKNGEAAECFKESLRLARADTNDCKLTRAKSFNRIGGILAERDDVNEAIKACEKSLSLLTEINRDFGVEAGETCQTLAKIYEVKGEDDTAFDYYQKAYNCFLDKLGPSDLATALVLNNLGINSARRNEFDEAFNYCSKSLEIRREKLGTDNLDTCDTLYNLANIVDEWGKPEEAMKFYTEALESYRCTLGADDLEVANCYQFIGKLHLKKEEDAQALRAFVESLRIYQVQNDEGERMAGILYELGKIYNRNREYDKGIESLAHSLKIQKRYDVSDAEIANTCNEIGVAYAGRQKISEAKKFLQRAMTMYTNAGKQDSTENATTMAHYASVLSEEEDYDSGLKLFQEALDIFKTEIGEESDEVAGILVKIGIIHNKRVDYEEALKLLTAALKIRSSLHGRDDMKVGETLFEIGKVMEEWGDSDEALDTYSEVIRIVKSHYGQRHIMVAEGLKRIGSIHSEKGDSNEALQCLNQAIVLQRRLLGEDALETGHTLLSIAAAYDAKSDDDEALASYTDALRIFRTCLGTEDVSVALAMNNVGINQARRKNFEKGIALCSEALRIRKLKLGDTHLDVADSCLNIANIFDEWGKDEKALRFYKEALNLYKAQLGDDDIEVANCLHQIGVIHMNQNDHRRAATCFIETIRIFRIKKGMDCLEVALALFNLGRVYGKTAEYEKALACFTECLRIRQEQLGDAHLDVMAVHRYIEAIERKRRR